MPEIHLKQPGFTYSACELFTENKEIIQNLKKQEIRTTFTKMNYIYKNELDKARFQHDMAHGYFKDLARRTASYKILRDKAFNVVKNPKYDAYQKGLDPMVYKFFDKKTAGSRSSLDLAEKLCIPIIRKFKKRTVYSGFIGNI